MWITSPLGRAIQAMLGLMVLLVGVTQVSVAGLLTMMAGLIFTVIAATAPPAPARVRSVRIPTDD
jgi:hypothetical protein